MALNKHAMNTIITEESFTRLLPDYLQRASRLYFTPVHIAKIASQWLTEGQAKKILDIGAGVGKFCMVGAINSTSHFYGVEHRPSLAELGNKLIDYFGIANATVLNENVMNVDFSNYDAFYLYNPFFENLIAPKRLNNEVVLNGILYAHYLRHTEEQLSKTKVGTHLVTFHGNNFEVPDCYDKAKESEDTALKLWIKK